MRRFGWMRLACLFLVLTVLAALARLDDGGAEARSLAARVPDAMFLTSESPGKPPSTPLTEDQISSLEDVSEEALQMDAEPTPRQDPASGAGERRLPAREKALPEPLAEPPVSEPPVFYRPAGPDAPAGSGPVCGDLRGAPAGGRIVFPLERQFFSSYEDTWGAPRTQGGHEGTDLMTPSGVPEYAITDGTVMPVAGSDAGGWNTLGGHAVMVRADYSMGPVAAGDLFYYAHLERKSPLQIGTRVSAGQVVGYAGDTGQGPPGTSGLFPPHLHLGWYDGTGGREEAPSGAMNPYPLLEWIKSNGGAITGDSDARFCEAPRTGSPTPSAHDGAWPTPANPGLSPDLDTEPGNPKPDRATREDDRDANAPTKKPPDPDGPKKPRNETLLKTPEENPPRPPKHDSPDTDHQRPARPDAGGDDRPPKKHELPEKDPPNNDPSEEDPPKLTRPESQYDRSTGVQVGSIEAPHQHDDPKPNTQHQHAADNDGDDDPGKPPRQQPPPAQASDRNP